LQPTPISANAAIPIENDAVLFVIARISSSRILSNWIGLAAVGASQFAMLCRSDLVRRRIDLRQQMAMLRSTVGRCSGARCLQGRAGASHNIALRPAELAPPVRQQIVRGDGGAHLFQLGFDVKPDARRAVDEAGA
jgi:hypothetical protein